MIKPPGKPSFEQIVEALHALEDDGQIEVFHYPENEQDRVRLRVLRNPDGTPFKPKLDS